MNRYGYSNLVMEYNVCRKKFRDEVKKYKLASWKEYTSNIIDPWKGMVKILKREDANKSQERTLCNNEGEYAEDIESTLSLLSEQFFSKPKEYMEEQEKIEKRVSEELADVSVGEDITVCEFRKALSEMRKATAPGNDMITNYVLQILARNCRYEKVYISMFNVCLKYGTFPDEWKQARLVLILKPATLLDSAKSMRPISLTSVFSKLLERIVLSRILYYVELPGMLSVDQHAYRKDSSTITALYEVSRFVQDALHDKQVCVMVFLDISGAFDRTWHGGILYRLMQYSVLKYLVKWIKCFLVDKTAYFKSAEVEHSVKLNQGCP